MDDKICIICGAVYHPTAYNQKRCAECSAANLRRCEACHRVFSFPGRLRDRRLCDACLVFYREAMSRNRLSPVAEEYLLKRRAYAAEHIDEMRRRMARAREVSLTHELTAANSDKHAHSKIWTLVSPWGETFQIRNLNGFVNTHPEYFSNAKQAIKTIKNIAHTMRKPDGNFKKSSHYMGWRLAALPETPEEIRLAAERRRIIDSKRKNGHKK